MFLSVALCPSPALQSTQRPAIAINPASVELNSNVVALESSSSTAPLAESAALSDAAASAAESVGVEPMEAGSPEAMTSRCAVSKA